MKKLLALLLTLSLLLIFAACGSNSGDDTQSAPDADNVGDSADNTSDDTNEDFVDLWIKEYKFPDATKEFSLNLFDNVAGVPIDLTKLENGNYTFDHDYYEMGEDLKNVLHEYSVKTLSEIQGRSFFNSEHNITVKAEDGEDLFTLTLIDFSDDEDETPTYYDCIKNNWWAIQLDPVDLLGEDVEYVSEEHEGDIILEKAVEKLGRPTYVNVQVNTRFDDINDMDAKLALNEKGIGGAIYDMVYDYDDFVIVFMVIEVVNNETVGRSVSLSRICYYTKESFKGYNTESDYSDYARVDILPAL